MAPTFTTTTISKWTQIYDMSVKDETLLGKQKEERWEHNVPGTRHRQKSNSKLLTYTMQPACEDPSANFMGLNLVSGKKPFKDSKQGNDMTGAFLEKYCNNRTDNVERVRD